jgi:hypothetical protein
LSRSVATSRTEALLLWLEPALSDRDDLLPDPLTVERELGRESLSFARAAFWSSCGRNCAPTPKVMLKRQLWDGLRARHTGLRSAVIIPLTERREDSNLRP